MAWMVHEGRMTAFGPRPSKRSTISSTVTIAVLRGQHRFLLDADDAFDEDVAGAVGLLRVDDRDVRAMRRHRGQLLAGERAGDELDVRVDLRKIGAAVAAEDRARHAGGAGGVRVRHRGMAVLFDLERTRPAAFDGVAEAVQRTDAGVAAPREDEPAGAAAADHLVVQHVGRHSDERQIREALADDLVARRERESDG